VKNDQRMLHAAIVWRFHRRLSTNPARPARRLIDVYESYRVAVKQPVLDITHAAFVPRLVEMGLWRERACSRCTATYLDTIETLGSLCPGCRLHQRFRCPNCGARAEGLRRGRRRKTCPHCGTPRASDGP
jgi:hypothetical protein